eukprot:5952585-Prymnesium_polylepis.1
MARLRLQVCCVSNLSRAAMQMWHKPGIRCVARALVCAMPLKPFGAMPLVLRARLHACDPAHRTVALPLLLGICALLPFWCRGRARACAQGYEWRFPINSS